MTACRSRLLGSEACGRSTKCLTSSWVFQTQTHPGAASCGLCAGGEAITEIRSAAAASNKPKLSWLPWPSSTKNCGRAGPQMGRKTSLNHARPKDSSIQAFSWYVHTVPLDAPPTSQVPRALGVLPFTTIMGGIVSPAALQVTRTETDSRLLEVRALTNLAPFLASTLTGECSNWNPLSSAFQIWAGLCSKLSFSITSPNAVK